VASLESANQRVIAVAVDQAVVPEDREPDVLVYRGAAAASLAEEQ
jgi:hypothetical protein